MSVNTVLGDAGVLNNPSRAITVVVPIDSETPPHLGRQQTRVGPFHAFGIPRRYVEAGTPEERLESLNRYDHPRATPEKALIDWLYLGQSPRSKKPPPPREDIDLSMLNPNRLRALAEATELSDSLAAWSH